jgi:hypothetical protein
MRAETTMTSIPRLYSLDCRMMSSADRQVYLSRSCIECADIRMKSPLRLSHQFIAEIYFTVHREDDRGRKLDKPGPSGLRFFRMAKPVVVPSVSTESSYADV